MSALDIRQLRRSMLRESANAMADSIPKKPHAPGAHFIAVDGGSDEPFRFAATVLPANDTLVVVHGIRSSEGWGPYPGLYTGSRLSEAEVAYHSQVIDHYRRLCVDYKRNCVFTEVTGDQAKITNDICVTADRVGADSVIVGSHAASAIQRGLMGSFSRDLLDECHCPVTIVRSKREYYS
eukprot:TRINITY_DN2676_c0_g1_i1.p2 TRINITY_DN2676_c0_g1~~TRINITY_DN2676_c0_g1_i1.p2  ORF type:complete len:180 (+),score=53.56 TRINITY_DN2676_c0_g1_i1:135-674(+)